MRLSTSVAAAQFAGSVAYMSDSQEQLSKQTADLQVLLSKVIILPSLNLPFHTHNEDLFWAKSEEPTVANQTRGHQLLTFQYFLC